MFLWYFQNVLRLKNSKSCRISIRRVFFLNNIIIQIVKLEPGVAFHVVLKTDLMEKTTFRPVKIIPAQSILSTV